MSVLISILTCYHLTCCKSQSFKPWANAFTMTQSQYLLRPSNNSESVLIEKQISDIYYDFNQLKYRADHHTVVGKPEINSTSIWIKNILYIIDYPANQRQPINCRIIDMKMGPPRPDWFIDSSKFEEFMYLLNDRDELKQTYHISKDSPVGKFHYFCNFPDQRPFSISAPYIEPYSSINGVHVVEYLYNYTIHQKINDSYFNFAYAACKNASVTDLVDSNQTQILAQKALGWAYSVAIQFK
eukprot:243030_1